MFIRKMAAAAALVALSGGLASANPSVTIQALHLRSGPGSQYGIVATMPQGADVEAWNCNGAWCQVSYNGQTGFASERYLDIGNARMTTPAYNSYAYAPNYAPPAPAYAPPATEYRAFGSTPAYAAYAYVPAYRAPAPMPAYAYAPAPAPVYASYAYYAPPPNPLDFPLWPWNWGRW